MAESIVSSLHTPDAEQAPVDTDLATNLPDPIDPNHPGSPVEPVEPAVQPKQDEDELDELIIEDFTIDGICGVY